jgi:hypothetical protein
VGIYSTSDSEVMKSDSDYEFDDESGSLLYSDPEIRYQTIILSFFSDRIIVPSSRDCRLYPCFELVRMSVRGWYAANLFYLLLETELEFTRFPETNVRVFRWSRVLYQDVSFMRKEDVYIAACTLFFTEMAGAVIAMGCSVYNAWEFNRQMNAKTVTNANVPSTISNITFLCVLALTWIILVFATGLYMAPFVILDESDTIERITSSFNLVHLMLVGTLCVGLVSAGGRVLSSQLLRITYVPEVSPECSRCAWICSGGSWRIWYIEQTLVCIALIITIWPAQTVDIYSVVDETPFNLDTRSEDVVIEYTKRYDTFTGLPIRRSCWDDAPTFGYFAAMAVLSTAFLMRVVDKFVKRGLAASKQRVNGLILLQNISSTLLFFGASFVILLTFMTFTMSGVPSNCFANQTACDPQRSTPSLAFWLDRSNASSVRQYEGPAGGIEHSSVVSLCMTGGYATTTVGEDTDTAYVFVFVFLVYMMASAASNLFFEAMLLRSARMYEKNRSIPGVDEKHTRDSGSIQIGGFCVT